MDQNLLEKIDIKVDVASQIDLWVQIFLLGVMVFYSIFAFLVYKQVGILNGTIQTPKAKILRKFTQLHLIATLALSALLIISVVV